MKGMEMAEEQEVMDAFVWPYDFTEKDRHGIGRVRIPSSVTHLVFRDLRVLLYDEGAAQSAYGTVKEFNNSVWVARVKIETETFGGWPR